MIDMKAPVKARVYPLIQRGWLHGCVLNRIDLSPAVRFEGQVDEAWHGVGPSESSLACAAAGKGPSSWQGYLEYVQVTEQAIRRQFIAGRIPAFPVLVCCPDGM